MICLLTVVAEEPEDTRPLPAGILLHERLVYSKLDETLTLDLYLPPVSTNPVPCVIVIQGGGFLSQDGQKFRPFADYLAINGFAAALIAYPGRPDHTYEETIAAIKGAVRFVRKIGGEYDIDTRTIGAMGRSAGATLAALIAVTGGVEAFEGGHGHSEYSSRIQAAVGFAGVYDFVSRFTDLEEIALQPRVETKIKSNGAWIGGPFSPENRHWLNASAINHLDPTDPPMLLIHSRDDQTVPWVQSRNMNARMREVGLFTEIEIYETGGHGVQPKGPEEDPKARMVDFFRQVLASK